jgi:hypothetical protein
MGIGTPSSQSRIPRPMRASQVFVAVTQMSLRPFCSAWIKLGSLRSGNLSMARLPAQLATVSPGERYSTSSANFPSDLSKLSERRARTTPATPKYPEQNP